MPTRASFRVQHEWKGKRKAPKRCRLPGASEKGTTRHQGGGHLPVVSKKRKDNTLRRWTPPRCIKEEKTTQRGGPHLLVALKKGKRTHQGGADIPVASSVLFSTQWGDAILLVALKIGGRGAVPPCGVEIKGTRVVPAPGQYFAVPHRYPLEPLGTNQFQLVPSGIIILLSKLSQTK